MNKKRKVILVTGSSRGMGASLVRSFAEMGFGVVINFLRSGEAASALHALIADLHGSDAALLVRADVRNRT